MAAFSVAEITDWVNWTGDKELRYVELNGRCAVGTTGGYFYLSHLPDSLLGALVKEPRSPDDLRRAAALEYLNRTVALVR